ncbi:hypothetical protein [Papillibacter cinnamivorans]|uniref:Uncharacterized protein n=1 Tax=Papillibacter cinnamivorans DSM 12816 TaxID=1122930 RepID=A0A1W1YQ96_9FIRM|nr:hypothetical protein [Papillibacter cinnamivorans]SMC38390.1 hypothetical protein SAMN02745168_0625 [Papillibacter cinnamivorans DSM 12816]
MTNEQSNTARIIDPTPEQIIAALEYCWFSMECGRYPCVDCYLYRHRDEHGYVPNRLRSSGCRPCSQRLAMDTIALIDRLSDFEHSQCAKLLEEVGKLRAELAESQRRENAAVDDLTDACYQPWGEIDKCKYCAKGKTRMCKVGECYFEHRGPQDAMEKE